MESKVSIRITQHKQHASLPTDLYVVKQQLDKNLRLKDKYVLSAVKNSLWYKLAEENKLLNVYSGLRFNKPKI